MDSDSLLGLDVVLLSSSALAGGKSELQALQAAKSDGITARHVKIVEPNKSEDTNEDVDKIEDTNEDVDKDTSSAKYALQAVQATKPDGTTAKQVKIVEPNKYEDSNEDVDMAEDTNEDMDKDTSSESDSEEDLSVALHHSDVQAAKPDGIAAKQVKIVEPSKAEDTNEDVDKAEYTNADVDKNTSSESDSEEDLSVALHHSGKSKLQVVQAAKPDGTTAKEVKIMEPNKAKYTNEDVDKAKDYNEDVDKAENTNEDVDKDTSSDEPLL
ncbi:uncharacterized protein LOC133863377 [Alnus glutinosa]|uniref:uncharacterized protein LOC133863377 n=1 Tax=Alnus glutinosa TaxID=3517 RepID=UPI002D78B272|nr:uncharacterized protein LOC133863377 [Alnus glutinosa]